MTNAPCCFCEKIYRVLSTRLAALALFGVGVGTLAFGLVAQYVFGIEPCVLCLWQRVPYIVVAVLGLIAFFQKPYEKRGRVLVAVCSFVFFVGFTIALYHSGVERHWWAGTEGCVLPPINTGDAASLREQLLAAATVRCDEVNWEIFGVTLANMNVVASLILAMTAALAATVAGMPMPSSGCKCCKKD